MNVDTRIIDSRPTKVHVVAVGQLADGLRTMRTANNPTRFLNRSNVKKFLKEEAKRSRPFNKFNRVSEDTLIEINEAVRRHLVSHVKRLPSKGQTI